MDEDIWKGVITDKSSCNLTEIELKRVNQIIFTWLISIEENWKLVLGK